ncbi:hypothetical protein BS78_03G304500 [Paspalum vaginatum]|nr:hypothetical protein BS78_03G304500 [Paspalum vaginatum]
MDEAEDREGRHRQNRHGLIFPQPRPTRPRAAGTGCPTAVAPQTWALHRVTCRTVRGAVMSSDPRKPTLHAAPFEKSRLRRILCRAARLPCQDVPRIVRSLPWLAPCLWSPPQPQDGKAPKRSAEIEGERGAGSGTVVRPAPAPAPGPGPGTTPSEQSGAAPAVPQRADGTSASGRVRVSPPRGTQAAGGGQRCRVAVMGAARPVPHVVGGSSAAAETPPTVFDRMRG